MTTPRTIRAAAAIVLACAAISCAPTYEQLDKLAPGMLLETEGAAPLSPTTPLRPISAKGLALTKVSEGFVPKLYNDAAGYCTIAYGHLIRKARCDGSEIEEFRKGVSEPRGGELLRVDMRWAQNAVTGAVNDDVEAELTDGQYAALCDFVFNAGGNAFRSSTLLKVVNARQFDSVPTQMRRWVLAGGKKWPGLVTRREREIELFFEGLPMPSAGPGPSAPVEPLDIREAEQ